MSTVRGHLAPFHPASPSAAVLTQPRTQAIPGVAAIPGTPPETPRSSAARPCRPSPRPRSLAPPLLDPVSPGPAWERRRAHCTEHRKTCTAVMSQMRSRGAALTEVSRRRPAGPHVADQKHRGDSAHRPDVLQPAVSFPESFLTLRISCGVRAPAVFAVPTPAARRQLNADVRQNHN
jgi:hypothetical protein